MVQISIMRRKKTTHTLYIKTSGNPRHLSIFVQRYPAFLLQYFGSTGQHNLLQVICQSVILIWNFCDALIWNLYYFHFCTLFPISRFLPSFLFIVLFNLCLFNNWTLFLHSSNYRPLQSKMSTSEPVVFLTAKQGANSKKPEMAALWANLEDLYNKK